MKEKIYTIPVTEAFGQDHECPVCLLESKLESEYTDYYLGPALMEPDSRIDTNKRGFCRKHFELLYNRQENRLGLALETDTHLREKLEELREASKAVIDAANGKKSSGGVLGSLSGMFSARGAASSRAATGNTAAAGLMELLMNIEDSCTVCSRLEQTMDRYYDVIMYLWSKETDFRRLFSEKKGFCLIHFKHLLFASNKYLNADERSQFQGILVRQQLENLERIEKELDWFTKKFDYRNNDAPWGNSKDALPRSIQKLKGYSNLK
ncbi:MAG TPA: DUF6062 family protein [Clostridia bacterium]|nr:DUF6062 family protein [Clostridia bacterium]